jgi:hypothetical protein
MQRNLSTDGDLNDTGIHHNVNTTLDTVWTAAAAATKAPQDKLERALQCSHTCGPVKFATRECVTAVGLCAVTT